MAALPARQTLSLSTLLARSATPARASARAAQKPAKPRLAPPRTLADLERASTLNAHDTTAPLYTTRQHTPPSALIMWVQVATCATCGTVHRQQPTRVLVRYAENEHSFHDRPEDIAALPPHLPRLIQTRDTRIPFCEACFVSAGAPT